MWATIADIMVGSMQPGHMTAPKIFGPTAATLAMCMEDYLLKGKPQILP